MNMVEIDNHELIQDVIVQINELADAKGVDKCVRIIDAIQKLNTLDGKLKDDEANNEAAIKGLMKRVDTLTEQLKGDDSNASSEAE